MTTPLIQASDLQARLTRPGCIVFDVRHDLSDAQAGRKAYAAGHIPGAIFLDNETQLCGQRTGKNGRHPLPSRADFAQFMRDLGVEPDTDVVVYDGANSMFAAHLWWMLRWIGHNNVSVLDGGWDAWSAMGGATESGGSQHVRGGATPATNTSGGDAPGMPAVNADDVLKNLDNPRFTVVDARAAERFRGDTEPLDAVAGHIPGAMNRPFSENLQSDGRFKPADQLRSEFQQLLGPKNPQDIVHQCGSGITACHNLFAMEIAGLQGSALYPGSWSEWCSDPTRPTAQGD